MAHEVRGTSVCELHRYVVVILGRCDFAPPHGIRWVERSRAICLRLVRQHQAEQAVPKARHSPGNVSSEAASEGGRSAGEEGSFFSVTDLRARPKHPDARESTLLRGIAEERTSWSNRIRTNGSPGLSCTGSMTEGARSLRRRGAHAQRSPRKLGPVKSRQPNEAIP